MREVLELGVLEPYKRRALHVLDIVVDAPDDRIDRALVALVGPVGLDAVAISIVVRAEVEARRRVAASTRRSGTDPIIIITEAIAPLVNCIRSARAYERAASGPAIIEAHVINAATRSAIAG